MSQIGKPNKKITIEPLEDPVPPEQTPATPAPAVPDKTPA